MKNKLLYSGVIVMVAISLGTGFLLGKIFSVPGLTCSTEINPLQGISILSTLFVAVFVAILVDKHKEVNRFHREFIIKRSEELLLNVQNLEKLLRGDEILYITVTSSLKHIMISYQVIEKVVKILKMNVATFTKSFEDNYKELNHLTTYTPISVPENERKPIRCVKGMLKYDDGRLTEIEQSLQKVKDLIFEFQISVADW